MGISLCFCEERIPWTIGVVGIIIQSYFSKWMYGFSDLKRSIYGLKNQGFNFHSIYSKEQLWSAIKHTLIAILALTIPFLFVVTLKILMYYLITN